ncbi:MAG: DUF7715 family protein [Ilumatobacteraceae bacterium]
MATKQGQGEVSGDYTWTVEGELVTPVAAACSSAERCGCSRGFPGLASSRATTTARVVELDHLTERDLRDAIIDSLERGGWFDLIPAEEAHELVDEHVECIAEICAAFPVGAVLGRAGTSVFDRSIARAA